MTEMRSYLESFVKEQHLTLADLAEKLGYRSKTSLIRIMDDPVRPATVWAFQKAMRETFRLSGEALAALERAAQIKLYGAETYALRSELLQLLAPHPESAPQNAQGPVIDCSVRGLKARRLWDLYDLCDDPVILYTNAQYVALVPALRRLLDERHARVFCFAHSDPEHTGRTLHAISCVLPILFHRRFSMYLFPERAAPDTPRGLALSDFMMCEYTAPNKKRMLDLFTFTAADSGRLIARTRAGHEIERTAAWLMAQPQSPCTPVKSDFSQHASGASGSYQASENPGASSEDLLAFLQSCAEMEKHTAIWRIKPDFCLDVVPADIIMAAARDNLSEATLAAAGAIFADRLRSRESSRKHVFHIMKKQALLAFAQTGRLSDHPYCLRSFTVKERCAIFSSQIALLEQNVFQHLYLLSDDAMLGDLEIAAYENRGLLIVPPHTSYNLSENYAEAMITYPPLSEAFRTFYVQHLIKTCCMTGAESLDYLRQLRDQLAQIGGDWESLER